MPTTIRKKRNPADIAQRVLREAGVEAILTQEPPHATSPALHQSGDKGLTLQELEDRRWAISPPVAKTVILAAGLPYEGRRARIIYSWASIFKAENLNKSVAKSATRESHPELFEDLLDTKSAAEMLGYRDGSSIQKLMLEGDVESAMYHRLVTQFHIRGLAGSAKNHHVGKYHHLFTCGVLT